MGPSHAGSGGLSTVEKADARREDDNPHKADLIISTSSGGKRHKSKRPILQVRRTFHSKNSEKAKTIVKIVLLCFIATLRDSGSRLEKQKISKENNFFFHILS